MAKKVNWDNYVGQKINHLTIIETLPISQPGDGRLCRCVCDCGNRDMPPLPIKRVIYGRKKSCGCANAVDLTGQKFGRLTVMKQSDERYRRQVVWVCKCECGKLISVPSDSLRRGGTRSCGCLAEEMRKHNAKCDKKNLVMGTNLNVIARDDTQVAANNKSGYTGVWFDCVRDRWRAQLGFQGRIYTTYHFCRESAIASRYAMKRIHEEFMAWWTSLSPEEQRTANNEFVKEKAVRRSLFDAHVARSQRMERAYKAVYLIFVVPGVEDYSLYAYCGDQHLRYINLHDFVFSSDKYIKLRDPVWFREKLTIFARTAAWDVNEKNPFASPYLPLEIVYQKGEIVKELPNELVPDIRREKNQD